MALISLVLALGMFITLLDTTIVNVALDHLRTTFDATVAQTQWIATGYLLAFVSVIPVSGWLSERFGARNAWLSAITVFLVGSALCAVADSLPQLVAFRVLQGIGGGLVMPVTMSMATRAAGPDRIHRATVAVALPGLLGPVLGSVLGGAVVEFWNWHWLFFINVPVCLIALVMGSLLLPKAPGQPGHRFDALGFALLTPGVAGIAYGISEAAGPDGFGSPEAWAPLACGIALLVVFTMWSLRASRSALIDVRVFARRSFGVGSLITFMSGFSTYALAFLLPLYYQQVRGETVFHTGLLLIPTGLGTMCFFLGLRNLANRIEGRLVVAVGVTLTMLGTLPFALAGAGGTGPWLLAGQFAQGLGFAATTFPVLTLALAELSYEQAPQASSAFSVVQRVGAPFGVAVIAVILQSLLDDAHTPAAGLDAFTSTFWWTFGLAAISLALSILLPAGKNAPPENGHTTAPH
ncbi:MDR family MFS transporter [Streptomyces sp. NPDC057654]|uniref:MDR family MFS transporter n=1 Tax=Streptomyces sp. NPDC057654 TaxID=3346196 RepID=UPI0036B32E95